MPDSRQPTPATTQYYWAQTLELLNAACGNVERGPGRVIAQWAEGEHPEDVSFVCSVLAATVLNLMVEQHGGDRDAVRVTLAENLASALLDPDCQSTMESRALGEQGRRRNARKREQVSADE